MENTNSIISNVNDHSHALLTLRDKISTLSPTPIRFVYFWPEPNSKSFNREFVNVKLTKRRKWNLILKRNVYENKQWKAKYSRIKDIDS